MIKVGDKVVVTPRLDCCAAHIKEFVGRTGEVTYMHRKQALVKFPNTVGTSMLRHSVLDKL